MLIVEDDHASAQAMAGILKRYGLAVTTVPTVAGAIASINKSNERGELPDFLVLDLMLPDGNGGTVLKHLRDQKLAVRVCVVTAASDTNMIEGIRRMKPECILRKPIDLGALLGGLNLVQ